MSYKKIVIEDSKGRRYYPVTSVKNIPDIEEVSEYIDIDNIKIDSSSNEKLGDTIVNIENGLKSHKHSANDISETSSKKFVTSSQLKNIETISSKITIIENNISKKADKEIKDSRTNKKYYLDVNNNRVFLREVR